MSDKLGNVRTSALFVIQEFILLKFRGNSVYRMGWK